jgi:hypothetical protein
MNCTPIYISRPEEDFQVIPDLEKRIAEEAPRLALDPLIPPLMKALNRKGVRSLPNIF